MVMITFDFSGDKLQSYILWITDSCSSCTPQTLSAALGHAPHRHTVTKLQWLDVLVLDYGRNLLLLNVNKTKEMLTDFKRKRKATPPVGC